MKSTDNEVRFFENQDCTVMTIGQGSNPTDNEFYVLTGEMEFDGMELNEYLEEKPFEESNRHPEIAAYFDKYAGEIHASDIIDYDGFLCGKILKVKDSSDTFTKYFLEIVSDDLTETYAFDQIDAAQKFATDRIYEIAA